MNSMRLNLARLTFWGLCSVAFGWLAFAVYFETNAGVPATREEWGHRAIGWFIEFVLVRTFVRGVRRYYQSLYGR